MPSLTVACLAKNEATSYLPSALAAWNQFADTIVVLDDHSTDDTAELCRSAGAFVVDWDGSAAWGQETPPRKALWEAAVQSGSDFIMVLDADMVPAKDPKELLIGGIDGVSFLLFDLWGEDVYRSDHYWRGHTVPRLWLVRNPHHNRGHVWSGRHIHSGHFPQNLQLERIVGAPREYSLLHYAYSRADDRRNKKKQYLSQGKFLTLHEWMHALSIETPDPDLLPLDVDVSWPLSKSL